MSKKIIALGDSWFHYPNKLDKDGNPLGVIYNLSRLFGAKKRYGVGNIIKYLVENHDVPMKYREKTTSQLFDAALNPLASADDVLGRCGEELMVMVYGYRRKKPEERKHIRTWLDLLVSRIARHDEANSFIILLSGGGNDIADDNLVDFLNDPGNGRGVVNHDAISKAVNIQLKEAYEEIFERVCTNFPTKQFHFLFHGYGYPPVNGRGVFTGMERSNIEFLHGWSPGPWLEPGFTKKEVVPKPLGEQIIGDFIDQFNTMLASLACPHPNGKLYYIDLRNITDKTNRDEGWCNELHFDHVAYPKASARFYEVIRNI